jgi:hypothetical protein
MRPYNCHAEPERIGGKASEIFHLLRMTLMCVLLAVLSLRSERSKDAGDSTNNPSGGVDSGSDTSVAL